MLVCAMATGWDHRLAALLVGEVVEAVGIVGAIGQHLARRDTTDQVACGNHIVLLAGAEAETDRQAERIDYGMDLGAEPASGTPESLGFRTDCELRDSQSG